MVRSARCRLMPVIAAMTALLAQQASAATKTGTLAVQVTVSSSCAVSSPGIDFGAYVAGAAGPRDIAGTIAYANCFGTAMTVELDAGLNGSGSTRYMKSGSSLLRYQIYQDSARTKVLATAA